MKILASVVLIASLLGNIVFGVGVEKCFQRDSISCLQLEILKSAKFFLGKKLINIGNFLNITSKQEQRTGKALSDLEKMVLESQDIQGRQIALEEYLENQIEAWWEGVTISWSFHKMMRAIPDFLIERSYTRTLVDEGRGKEKKQPDLTIPLLIAIKLKALAAIAYMAIAVVAQKAVLAGVISLLVSGFIALKNLSGTPKLHSGSHSAGWQSQMTPQHDAAWRDSEGSAFQKAGASLVEANGQHVYKI